MANQFINFQHKSSKNIRPSRALAWYSASLLVLSMGSILAARHYPGGFDWPYTVASALASQKHNPTGSIWFASALILSMLLLWPYVSALKKQIGQSTPATEFIFGALRIGLICGVLVGMERLLIYHLSDWIYKAHETLAILFFLGLYFGILGLLVQVMLRQRIYVIPVLLVVMPLMAIGISQIWLYFDQRDLGWVDTSWREMGIPFWLSFAFWQWLAVGFLWTGLGLLSLTRIKEKWNL